jgi:hypothetical protein
MMRVRLLFAVMVSHISLCCAFVLFVEFEVIGCQQAWRAPDQPDDVQGSAKSGRIRWPSHLLDEVALHTAEKDCWLTIHQQVYDVTKYLVEHPGGLTS